jgi:NDP-sugar pyrophosphorylase family protein
MNGNTQVTGDAYVGKNAVVTDSARVSGKAVVGRNARVCGNAVVTEYAVVTDDAVVTDHAVVNGYSVIDGNARVGGTGVVTGNARVGRDAAVNEPGHAIVIEGFFRNSVTVYRTKTGACLRMGSWCVDLNQAEEALAEFATEHGWTLPEGWERFLSGIRAVAATWH